MSEWWLGPMAFALSAVLTGLLRRYALARNLLDTPNERSSHTVPMPRGGGVAIVATFCAGVGALMALGQVSSAGAWAAMGAGFWVALIGFLDDHFRIAARWRLLVHFLAAAWALSWLGGMPPVPWFGIRMNWGWAGDIVAAVLLVWLLNLYNFMDGIDGIAALEAVTVAAGGAALWWITVRTSDAVVPVLIGAATAGFLIWNFPRARIFMGDAGSGFLGLIFGVLAIWSGSQASELFWCWMILLGVFAVDATVTLVRRVARGERFYEAHRSHAYQFASRRYGQHRVVTLAIGAINLLWLFPVAALVALGFLDGTLGVALAYAPLVFAAFHYNAGAKERQ